MPTMPVVAASDGPRLTVSQIVGAPRFIPERVVRDLRDTFIIDAVFRQGPPASSGAVGWEESAPLFADDEPEIVAEFGEIPIGSTSRGHMRTASTTRRGLGISVSRTMRDRNNVGEVERRITLTTNTIRRAWDRLWLDTILSHPGVHTLAAAEPWYSNAYEPSGSQTTGKSVRYDITQSELLITDSTPDQVERPDDFFGFQPDLLVIPHHAAAGWKDNDAVNSAFVDILADENIRYTGVLPRRFVNFNILVSNNMPGDIAVMLQRGMTGFISDERALESTPLRYDERRETYESYTTRQSVAGLDQPLSATVITGIRGE